MPKPILLLAPSGSFDRSGPISPVISGGVIQVAGRHGSAWQVAESTVNHVFNPIVANNLSNIGNGAGANGALTHLTDLSILHPNGHIITTAVRQTLTAPSTNQMYFLVSAFPLTQGQDVSAQFMMRGSPSTIGKTVRCYIWESGSPLGNTTSGYKDYIITGDWQYLEATGKIVRPDSTGLSLYVQMYGTSAGAVAAGDSVDVTAAQVEAKAYCTPFAHGSMGAGHSWAGTVHGSRSTRIDGVVDAAAHIAAAMGSAKGTVLLRYHEGPSRHSGTGYLFHAGSWSNSFVSISRLSIGQAKTYFFAADPSPVSSAATISAPLGYRGIALTYAPSRVRIHNDLGEIAETLITEPYTIDLAGKSGKIGTAGTQNANTMVEAVLVFEEELSESEITHLLSMEHAWSWNELTNPGRITNIITRSGGAFAVSTELYLADRSGRKIERLPIDLPVEGEIAFNEDARPSRRFSLQVNDPLRLEPFVDFLIPVVVLTDAAGNREVGQFGHFMATPPAERLESSRYSGSLEGMDATWILDNEEIGSITIPAGTDTGAAAREVALASMDLSQIQFPDTGVPLTEDWQPSPGESRFQVIADLYNAANWYVPTMDGNGVLVTKPWMDISIAPAVRSYGTAEGSATIIPPAESVPDWGRLKNRIIVRNLRPNEPPIYGRAWVKDATSPLHPDRIGGSGRPLWLTNKVDDNQVATNEEATAKAELLLANAASWYRKLSIKTVIDLRAGAHEILELNLVHQGARYEGNWLRRAWAVKLRGITATLDAQLTRTEKWKP